ncbi:MAG: quinate 5-dehydrogenase, partial [Anaerolineales bacterium]
MKQIGVIHLNSESSSEMVTFLGEDIEIVRLGCGGEPDAARRLISEYDGRAAAIGLEGLPARLDLG